MNQCAMPSRHCTCATLNSYITGLLSFFTRLGELLDLSARGGILLALGKQSILIVELCVLT